MEEELKVNFASEKVEKKCLVQVIKEYIKFNKSTIEFLYKMNKDKTNRKRCKKHLQLCDKAMINVEKITHLELLREIYVNILGANVMQVLRVSMVCSDETWLHWDTEEGYQEYLKEKQEKMRIAKEKEEAKRLEMERIKLAREQGKKVEMVFDPETKETKTVIIDKD